MCLILRRVREIGILMTIARVAIVVRAIRRRRGIRALLAQRRMMGVRELARHRLRVPREPMYIPARTV